MAASFIPGIYYSGKKIPIEYILRGLFGAEQQAGIIVEGDKFVQMCGHGVERMYTLCDLKCSGRMCAFLALGHDSGQ